MSHRPPEARVWTDDGLVVDSFAGGGGASLGIEWALGRSPDIAINHDREAIALHAANHPTSKHYPEDVWKVDPVEACGGRPVTLMWLSPDCFPAGTMVLTDRGYRPIEAIGVGDHVMTHRCRWRRVTETMRAVKLLSTIRGHGHPGLAVSSEHPFWARQHSRHAPSWVPASGLGKGWYWASPKHYPALEVPPIPTRPLPIDEKVMWLVGRYVGDGWTRLTDARAELVITCNRTEADGLRERLAQWTRLGPRAGAGELAWHERETGTAYQFTTSHRGLVTWLREHFGHHAEAKRLPGWALGMDPELRSALLAGYLSADGWQNEQFVECSTVSKALAFSIKALAQSLGKTVTVYVASNNSVIEGRQVSARPIYKVRWRHEVERSHRQTFTSQDMEWAPIREAHPTTQTATVYNIGVDEDESYIVEGIAVHNCKHFSKAKGGKPVSKRVRGLAWVAVRWAVAVRPRIIVLENVEEFQSWGPVDRETQRPDPERKGHTFRRFVGRLRTLGYAVEWKELRACDYGAPTIRKRLFLIARCDGLRIRWPAATHGKGRSLAWRTAAECIQWEIPCPSIFERKKPLADNTLRRIARGIQKFVVDSPSPFIVGVGGRMGQSLERSLRMPYQTITAKADAALVAPTLIQCGYGEREGQAPRVPGLNKPLGTIVAGGGKHALVSAFLAKHYGGFYDGAGLSLFDPLHTITTDDHHSLVTAHIKRDFGTSVGAAVDSPLPTITADGGGHASLVRALLVAYYGNEKDGASLFDPMRTLSTRDRFGLVTVLGVEYEIADIGMRMLAPRELYRAQGFPDSYNIDIQYNGKLMTKTAQVRMVGNSVCPDLAAAIVRANVPKVAEAVA